MKSLPGGSRVSPADGPAAPTYQAADLYCDLEASNTPGWRECLPGLTLATLGALAAGFIADRYGAPLTLMALLSGLSLNFLGDSARLHAGLDFASRTLLRWGIVFAGLQVTFVQLGGLGVSTLLAIMAIALLTVCSGIVASRALGHGTSFGLLAGSATAICGASAALAVAATLGEKRIGREQLAIVLIGIAAFSPAAMIVYPIIAHYLGFGDDAAGFLLGAAIHDVAQALGAGYSYSQPAGEIALIVKLARVALLAPLVALIAFAMPEGARSFRLTVPWFIVGFVVLAGINSTGLVPHAVLTGARHGTSSLLALAVTAIAIRSPLHDLAGAGFKPLLLIAIPTFVALIAALAAADLLF